MAEETVSSKRNGAALITVLMVIFVLTAIVSELTAFSWRSIKRVTNQNIRSQSYNTIIAAVDFARLTLLMNSKYNQDDDLTQVWAHALPLTSVGDNLQFSGQIDDEQGKFNLNGLINYSGAIDLFEVTNFQRLLQLLNLPSSLALNIANYIANPAFTGQATSLVYRNALIPYNAAGRELVDLSELIFVNGMNSDYLNKLKNYITAIPRHLNTAPGVFWDIRTAYSSFNQINVNTASAEVISAKTGLPTTIAQQLLAQRTLQPFLNLAQVENFIQNSGVNLQLVNLQDLGVQSNCFKVQIKAYSQGGYELNWVSFLYRTSRFGVPAILWQHPA